MMILIILTLQVFGSTPTTKKEERRVIIKTEQNWQVCYSDKRLESLLGLKEELTCVADLESTFVYISGIMLITPPVQTTIQVVEITYVDTYTEVGIQAACVADQELNRTIPIPDIVLTDWCSRNIFHEAQHHSQTSFFPFSSNQQLLMELHTTPHPNVSIPMATHHS